jgi:hypothetical protein
VTLHPECKHSNRAIAEHLLVENGRLGAHEATYSLACPWDGALRRNTRLAATVETLRKDGWLIDTFIEPGEQATYIFRGRPV